MHHHFLQNFLGIPVDEIWEAYGGFLIQYTMETGWDELLRAMSPDLQVRYFSLIGFYFFLVQGFLDGLDSLHYFIDRMVYSTKLRGPAFRCESSGLEDGSLLLHYYSTRTGLYPIVKGTVKFHVFLLSIFMKSDCSGVVMNRKTTMIICAN